MQKYWNTVLNERGEPRSGASVAIQQNGSNVTIYADQDGNDTKTNPLTTDSRGYFEFYAPTGEYDLVVTGDDFVEREIEDGALVGGLAAEDITFLQSGSGAVADSVQNTLRARGKYLKDFIPTTLHAGIYDGTNITAVHTYIQ